MCWLYFHLCVVQIKVWITEAILTEIGNSLVRSNHSVGFHTSNEATFI